MDKVYLIMIGEYSDRRRVGFCTTEEEAMQYCAVHNRPNAGELYAEYYDYEEHECLDGKVGHVCHVGYSFLVTFKHDGNSWPVQCVIENCISTEHKPRISTTRGSSDIAVYVWLSEVNEEKAKKIAQDTLYKYLYEKMEAEKDFAERLKKYIQPD